MAETNVDKTELEALKEQIEEAEAKRAAEEAKEQEAVVEDKPEEPVVETEVVGEVQLTEEPKQEDVVKIPTEQEVLAETTEDDISDLADLIMAGAEADEASSPLAQFSSQANQESESIKNLRKLQQSKNSLFSDEDDSSLSFDDEPSNDDIRLETDDDKKNDNEELKSFADSKSTNNSKLSFMDAITVDLNNITITDKPPLKQINDMKAIFDTTRSTFFVTCCQSGYSAHMSGLTLAEKNAINNSNLDLYGSKQKLYKTIYNKIENMNFDKPKFDDWLKMTAIGDWNTLLFGVYCQTFIDNNEFNITCGNCGKVTEVVVDNCSLVEAKDKDVYAKIDEIVASNKTPQDLVESAYLYKSTRIMLNDSKIILDLKIPSLWDNLKLIRSTSSKTLQEYSETLSLMMFITHMYMLDVQTTYNTKEPTYYEIKDKDKILSTLLKLSNTDGEVLEDEIENKLGKYNINYQIHNARCAHCHDLIDDIPVDMETVLFTRINKERKPNSTK
jgi:hypothetical protein